MAVKALEELGLGFDLVLVSVLADAGFVVLAVESIFRYPDLDGYELLAH